MHKIQRCCAFFIYIFIFLFGTVSSLLAKSINDGKATQFFVSKSQSTRATSANESLIKAEIEKGTPPSLRSAINRLRLSGSEMTEREKLLLYVASSIYGILYPTERINWTIPELTDASPYRNAIETAKNGAYDFTTAKSTDFLALVLPSLVLFTAPNVKNYYAEAESTLQSAVKQNNNSAMAHFLLATLYERQEKTVLASKEYEAAFLLQSECVPLAVPYIESLLAVDRPKDAYNAAVKVLLKNNNNVQIIKLCAESAFAAKDFALADQYVNQVLQNDPNNARFMLLRSRILLENGDYLRSSAALDVFAKKEKPNSEYYIVRVRLLRDWHKNVQSAANVIAEALAAFPNNNDLIVLAASIAGETGQKINNLSASQLSNMILVDDPANADALAIMVQEAIKNEQWQTAYDRVQKLALVSNSVEAQLLRIQVCLGLKKTSEALDFAKSLYNKESQNESVQSMYINALISSKNTAEASNLIENLLVGASPKLKSALYYQRSRLANDSAVQLNDLRSSLTANPRNEDALYGLYGLYYAKKDYRKALYYLKQVIAINPTEAKLQKQQAELEKLLAD